MVACTPMLIAVQEKKNCDTLIKVIFLEVTIITYIYRKRAGLG